MRNGDLLPEHKVSKAKKKLSIAIVYSRTPLPANTADQMTVSNLISYLAHRGHRIDLYCTDSRGKPSTKEWMWLKNKCENIYQYSMPWWKPITASISAIFKKRPFQVELFNIKSHRETLLRNANNYDVIYTYYIRSAEISKNLHQTNRKTKTYLAYQLSQVLNTERISKSANNIAIKWFYKFECFLLKKYEATIWESFSKSVVIGKKDLESINKSASKYMHKPINNYIFGAHGTDITRFKVRKDINVEAYSLVFSGVMRTPTNINAVEWFVKNVWSRVRADFPQATFNIVGREPPKNIKRLSGKNGINVTGTVDDPSEYIAKAHVCINPMQAGGGMQNKLIEYLACAKPIVATSVANEGVMAKDGIDLVIADDPLHFSKSIVDFFNDTNYAERLSKSGRLFVEQNWSWEAHWKKLEREFYKSIKNV